MVWWGARRMWVRFARACWNGGLVLWLLLAMGHGVAAAEPDATPASARAFAELLDDPAFRAWLKGQLDDEPEATSEAPDSTAPVSLTDAVAGQITGARMRLADLADAAPRLPGELVRAASTLQDEIGVGGLAETGLLLALYSAIGAGAQYLFLRWTRPIRRQVLDGERKTVAARVGALSARIVLAVGAVLAFAIGALASFAALGPALSARPIGLIGFFAILWMQLAFITSRLLFSPARPQPRVISSATPRPISSTAGSISWPSPLS